MCDVPVTDTKSVTKCAALSSGLVDDANRAVDKLHFVCQMLLSDNVSLSDRGVSGLYFFLWDVAGTITALVDAL